MPAVSKATSEVTTPITGTYEKRVAALEKARAARAEKRTYAKRVAALEKARKAKVTRAKRSVALEKARAERARIAEFNVSTVDKSDLVAFVEEFGFKKDLLHFLDERMNATAAE